MWRFRLATDSDSQQPTPSVSLADKKQEETRQARWESRKSERSSSSSKSIGFSRQKRKHLTAEVILALEESRMSGAACLLQSASNFCYISIPHEVSVVHYFWDCSHTVSSIVVSLTFEQLAISICGKKAACKNVYDSFLGPREYNIFVEGLSRVGKTTVIKPPNGTSRDVNWNGTSRAQLHSRKKNAPRFTRVRRRL